MLKSIIGVGINFKNRRKDIRMDLRAKLCAFSLIKYDPKTDEIDYGGCSPIEIRDIGPNGICVLHNGNLKKGDLVEFRTRYSIEDSSCVKCQWFQEIIEDLPVRAFIGKVIWRSDNIAGLNFVMIHERDRTYLRRQVLRTLDNK